MSISLQINGRVIQFSEEEIVKIVEKHFASENEKAITEEKGERKPIIGPLEGYWYPVKPFEINKALFQNPRKDLKQEDTRRRIIQAFKKIEKEPSKYERGFETMIPIKRWDMLDMKSLKRNAVLLGDRMTNLIEQYLEWAQRISNGEEWETLCNVRDTTKHYRIVVGETGETYIIGGSLVDEVERTATNIQNCAGCNLYILEYAVPSVVKYERYNP